MITVSIVEDNTRTRHSVAALLRNVPDISCLSMHASGEEALKAIPKNPPKVVLMDINLPGMNGIECVSKLKLKLPNVEILMLTNHDDPEQIFSSLRAGATGYLLKTMPRESIIRAITEAADGGVPMPASIARTVVSFFSQLPRPASEVDTLTLREREILGLLSKGCQYKEIADRLAITYGTVRNHLQAIYRKLHVQTRAEAALKYFGREE